ncbi:MAG: carbohydrate kinase family protein, partial [Pirellulales bacterium]|nr:carbohydrate kinase family protein [Pirellulales bacterium]
MADVGCAGILVADTFCGPIARLPREGELLAIDQMPLKVGGCAANVAIDLAKHGVSTDVCGCVGNDDAADVVLRRLEAAGVGCGQVRRVDSHPTSKTVILLVEGQDRRYLHS